MQQGGVRRTEAREHPGATGCGKGGWQAKMAGTTCAYEGLAAGTPHAAACVSAPAGSRGNNRTRSCIAVTAAEADPEFSPAHPVPLSPAAREIERGGGARS